MPNLIRTTRADIGMTGRELAERLGITVGAVSQMERSERDGTIQLATLDRALRALGRQLRSEAASQTESSRYGPESITETINSALDDDDPAFALRALTRAAQQLREHPGAFSADDLVHRPSRITDARWENLFRAIYGGALPAGIRPAWATPARLPRPWYVSQFPALRQRAKQTTPPALRELNIFIDAKSLVRA